MHSSSAAGSPAHPSCMGRTVVSHALLPQEACPPLLPSLSTITFCDGDVEAAAAALAAAGTESVSTGFASTGTDGGAMAVSAIEGRWQL